MARKRTTLERTKLGATSDVPDDSNASSNGNSNDIEALLTALGISAADVRLELLELALVDISSSATQNNEKLEFLGDAALRLAAAEFLMERYPQMALGDMSAVRSQIVSDRTLATLAKRYHLRRYLILSKSAAGDKAGTDSRLADTFEAILGALYLSAGNLSLIRPWLDPHFARLTQSLRSDPARQNYKAALQELTQSHYKSLPTYKVSEISQIHGDEERFQAEAWFQDKLWGTGKGRSMKMAEQAAARIAFNALEQTIEEARE
ncbi:ribonuclease III [Synechococcus sp. PCC 7335]|uniref:ribonuclease III n=1 Tax=Synechococcus sp. (strain ATCC 29403 / PCC 7335) TaxID=91464 RepID=UPI00017ECEA6|nr:ribonuclease III [Synechococcus sp. PCC 7335]EDX86066.1 ribonuclease III [Synechococcus sp. PCC 7335]